MRAATLVAVFAAYTATSSFGLVLLRIALPRVHEAYAQGSLFGSPVIPAVAGAIAYLTSFVLWLFIVAHVPLAQAYPVAVGLTLAFTALGAHFVIGEKVNLLNLLGILAVFLGVVLISASARDPV